MKSVDGMVAAKIWGFMAAVFAMGEGLTVNAAEGPSTGYGFTPYTLNSAVENQLDFPTNGSVTSPNPTGLNLTSNASANTMAGAWTLSAQGATRLALNLTTLNAQTAISGGELLFNTDTGGLLGNILSLSLITFNWTATSTVSSAGMTAGAYRYEFDASIADALFALNPSVWGSLNLTISDGAGVRYQSSGGTGLLNDLLGLNLGGVLSGSSVQDAGVNFLYSGTGNINITFSASNALSTNLLGILGSDISTIYSLGNTDIISIPEPGSLLLAVTGLLLILRRRVKHGVR